MIHWKLAVKRLQVNILKSSCKSIPREFYYLFDYYGCVFSARYQLQLFTNWTIWQGQLHILFLMWMFYLSWVYVFSQTYISTHTHVKSRQGPLWPCWCLGKRSRGRAKICLRESAGHGDVEATSRHEWLVIEPNLVPCSSNCFRPMADCKNLHFNFVKENNLCRK